MESILAILSLSLPVAKGSIAGVIIIIGEVLLLYKLAINRGDCMLAKVRLLT